MARVGFLGSPEPAAYCLRALVDAGHDVVLAVTRPDTRRSRGSTTSPTPVKRLATELGIPVSERVADVLEVGADLGVVVAFGRLVRPAVLDRLLMVNLHFSLLPRWRGAAPVERAILAGDESTGVCLMKLEEGLDTGPVYARVSTAINPKETSAALRHRLTLLGSDLLVERLAGGVGTLGEPVAQEGQVTYAAKLTTEDLHIDWSQPAVEVERLIRVGRAWTTFRSGRLIVWDATVRTTPPDGGPAMPAPAEDGRVTPEPAEDGRVTPGSTEDGRVRPGTLVDGCVATGAGWLQLESVQLDGRKRQPASDWLRGARPQSGEAFA